MFNTAEAVLWENFIFLYAYVNTGERLKASSIISQLKGEKYQTQIKLREGNSKYKSRIQWHRKGLQSVCWEDFLRIINVWWNGQQKNGRKHKLPIPGMKKEALLQIL